MTFLDWLFLLLLYLKMAGLADLSWVEVSVPFISGLIVSVFTLYLQYKTINPEETEVLSLNKNKTDERLNTVLDWSTMALIVGMIVLISILWNVFRNK